MKKLPQSEIARFVIVGSINNGLSYAIFAGLFYSLGNVFHYQILIILNYLIIIPISYLGMKFLVFRSNDNNYASELLKFSLLVLAVYLVNFCAVYLFVERIKCSIMASQLLSLLIAAIVSYLLNRVLVFRVRRK